MSNAPDDVSLVATGAGGIIGVNVDVAFWPVMSVTWYVNAVLVPEVALAAATKVTIPVLVLSVYVPSFAIVTTPSASHVAGDELGVIRHVNDALRPAADVAIPEVPVMVVNATVPPGITDLVSGVAVGTAGKATVGVIVAPAS